MLECQKYLIDSFGDYGQHDENPDYSDSTRKPIWNFARYFDKCGMSNEEAINFKNFRKEPFYQYFVGDGTSGDACFPGNIFDPIARSNAASPIVGAMMDDTYVQNYIKPWGQILLHKAMEYLHDYVGETEDTKLVENFTWTTDDYHKE